jgi:arylsulfatase A-like enzyme
MAVRQPLLGQPAVHARRDILTGSREFMWRPWGPLEPFDHRLPRLLEANGFSTGLVTDHYHYWEEPGNGYMQSFQSVEMIRGHEFDFWKHPLPADEPLPQWVENIERWRPGQGRWYYANVRAYENEEDYFPARVMSAATRWLDEHATNAPFFLQVESFDVHEPFDVPEPYASMYGNGNDRDRFNLWPPYQDCRKLAEYMASATPEELEFIRAQYAGKVTMLDRWFGELARKLDALELWDDTMVIVTTDHGHDLGERDVFAKA